MIEQLWFKAMAVRGEGNRILGYIDVPVGAKVLYLGATPPRGDLCMFVETGGIVGAPTERREYTVLKAGDAVPPGFSFVGHILATPVLFVYERDKAGILQPN